MNIKRILRKLSLYGLCKRDPVAYSRKIGVKVGQNCKFHGVELGTYGSEPYLVEIGDHVEITAKVKFLTHDGGVWVFRGSAPDIDAFKPIYVGNNVFLGRGTILLPGARVGNNVVIGAGSVVSGEIPSDSVCAGVPARKIRTLSEYRSKIQPYVYMTKRLSATEKRAILEERLHREQK